jgi:twitching motility protein PilT
MSGAETRQLSYSVLTDAQKKKFEACNELDFSFGVKGLARFRGNLFMQRGAVSGVFRRIPLEILTFDQLNLPPILKDMSDKPQGLILVTGPTGSGKSTTLAAMIDYINSEKHQHILTIEDPIEYIHVHKSSIINQREIGSDTANIKEALRYVLRQDPDVVLVGEMRDLETIEAALTIAETGHLCMATLHTNGTVQTINRVLDVFPPHQQDQIRAQLSFTVEGIVSQQLLPNASGSGRVMSMEILVPTPAIRNLIREDKLHQVYSQMQMGQSKHGMLTMNQSLFDLYQKRLVTLDDVLSRSPDAEELRTMISGKRPSRFGR